MSDIQLYGKMETVMAQTIMIVDDDEATRTLVGLILERSNFKVLKAASGLEAFKIMADTLPDLVLLDVMMPQMNGYEVSRRIKADPLLAHIPVILLSARAQPASQLEGIRAGALDYITKPISPSNLMTRLQAVLDRSTQGYKLTFGKPGEIRGVKDIVLLESVVVKFN